MKTIKTKPLFKPARAPIRTMRRVDGRVKREAHDISEHGAPQEDRPESGVERSLEGAAQNAPSNAVRGGRSVVSGIRTVKKIRNERGQEQSEPSFESEAEQTKAGEFRNLSRRRGSSAAYSSNNNVAHASRDTAQNAACASTENLSFSHERRDIVRERQAVSPKEWQAARVNPKVAVHSDARKEIQQEKAVKNTYLKNYASGRSSVKTRAKEAIADKGIKTKAAAKAPKRAAVKTVKVSEKGIKTGKTIKTSARAAKGAATAIRQTAVTAKAAKATVKTVVAVGKSIAKAIAAAVRALVTLLAAGGWVVLIVVVVIAVIFIILGSAFGIFFSNDTAEGRPMSAAIAEINADFSAEVDAEIMRLSAGCDHVYVVYEGDADDEETLVYNWTDVLGVYSVLVTTDAENGMDVIEVTPEKVERLRKVLHGMNTVSYETTDSEETVTDENGEKTMVKTRYIHVDIQGMDYDEGAVFYSFDASQNELLAEVMQPEYYPMLAALMGEDIGDGGEFTLDPNLPGTTLGEKIVQAAYKYKGYSYSQLDCSGLVRRALKDCGVTLGGTAAGLAKNCFDKGILFTDASDLQMGDLIFFAQYSEKDGYCGNRRCGGGKCGRWRQIHHVAIYIDSEHLIDSTGGKNSVQIRRHWGKNGSEWKWICFGRPALLGS